MAKLLNSVPEFASEWKYLSIPASFDMSFDELQFYSTSTFKEVDLFLHQPISADHRGAEFSTEHLRENAFKDATQWSFQYLHWEGYSPTFNSPYGLPDYQLGYVDSLVALAVLEGVSLETFLGGIDKVKESVTSSLDEIETWGLSQLRARESGESDGNRPIYFIATDFIQDIWRDEQLFYSMNHPSKHVLWQIAAPILRQLGYDPSTVDISSLPDPLDQTILPTQSILEMPRKNKLYARSLKLDVSVETFYSKQFKWFAKQDTQSINDFLNRVTLSRPWILSSYNHAFK